jgi:hypothetical protein
VGHSFRFAILATITIATSAVNLIIISADNRPIPWDYAYYLSKSLIFYDALKRGSLSQFVNVYNDPYRPPFFSLAVVPFYAIFGTSYLSAMLANVAFLAVLVASTYKLGELVGSESLGLVLAGFVSVSPGIMTFARISGLDYPVAVMVTASICLALACEGFKKRGYSIGLGVALGLGMLTKWTFIVFVAPLLAIEVFRYRRKINFVNLCLAFGLFIAISSTWYIGALQQNLLSTLGRVAWGPGVFSYGYAPSESLLDRASLLYYPGAILVILGPVLGWSLIALAIISLVLMMMRLASRRMNMAQIGSLLSSLLISLMVFTFVVNKGVRFILPVIPVFLALLVLLVWRIRRIGPLILIILAIGGACISFAGALYPQLGASVGVYYPTAIENQSYSHYNYTTYYNYYNYEYSFPDSRDWHVLQALEFTAAVNANARVGVLADTWVFNQDTLKYYSLWLGLTAPNDMTGLSFLDYRDGQMTRIGGYAGLSNFDVIFVKTGDVGDLAYTKIVRGILTRLSNPGDPFYLTWKMVKSFDLPDGSQLIIFTKNLSNSNSNSSSTSNPSQVGAVDMPGNQLPGGGFHFRRVSSTNVSARAPSITSV